MNRNVKQSDLFIFFEILKQLEPEKVLDVGLLLKRAGCVCRKTLNREFSEEIILDGVDFTLQPCFKALKNVYHNIIDVQAFLQQAPKPRYDCTFMIGFQDDPADLLTSNLLLEVQSFSSYLVSDYLNEKWSKNSKISKKININNDIYYLYQFGE